MYMNATILDVINGDFHPFSSMNLVAVVQRSGRLGYSTTPSESANDDQENNDINEEMDDFLGSKVQLEPQGVDPKRGWGYRGVHKVLTIE